MKIEAREEVWPLAGAFTISRGSRTEARVVTATVEHDGVAGRGECVPYPHYGETVDSVLDLIRGVRLDKPDRHALQALLPAGAARNAIDCALWDWEAKCGDRDAATLAGCPFERPVTTVYTISLGAAEDMANAARSCGDRPILKLKLGGMDDAARVRAVHAAAPRAQIVVDANEAWRPDDFVANSRACLEAGVSLIEQPLPAGEDEALRNLPHVVPICADESIHTRAELDGLRGKYDAINVKLDKAGGLTEALALLRTAKAEGYMIMVGCMLGTSLGMAPAMLLAQEADLVDLDGPLLLARDRDPGLKFMGSMIQPPPRELWG